MATLLLFDTREKDLARDISDLLIELGCKITMITETANQGRTLQGKEDVHFANPDGAIFLITPGATRDWCSYPSPSVSTEMGRAHELFKDRPEKMIYLVERGCRTPSIDQRCYIEFERGDIRSVISAVTSLVRNLNVAGLLKSAAPARAAVPLSQKAISLLQAIDQDGDQGYRRDNLAEMTGYRVVEVDHLIDQLGNRLQSHPGDPGETYFTLSPSGRRVLFQEAGRDIRTNTLAVASARAQVHVPADDEGTIMFYLTIVNMGTAPLRVETITPSHVAADGNDLAILAPVSKPPENTVGPGGIGEIGVRFPIGAQAIRVMLRCVQRADNKFSSPRMQLVVKGDIAGNVEGRKFQLPFTVASYSPELNIQCPSAKGA